MLAELVRASADDVLTRRGLDPAIVPATVTVERPRNPQHGHYATNVALQTAAKAGVPPREFAQWLADALSVVPGVRSVEVAGPGFLNLRLETAAQAEVIPRILAAGQSFGIGDSTAVGSGPGSPATGDPGSPATGDPGSPATGSPGRPATGNSGTEYDVRYAHARLAALARNAAELGVSSEGAPLGLLDHDREGELIRMLGEFPRVAATGEAATVVGYLARVAAAGHDFADTCRVLPMGDEEPDPRHAARVALCQATRQVLANGLRLLGLSAPERM